MWSILYNGHTVALPDSDDFYTVITDTTKMFTTNVDLPITEDLIKIFNIKGLLTREDGAFFKKVTLPCTLQGFGVRIPCKISIESIKQKEGLLNLYLEAKSIFGYNIAEQVNQGGFKVIWDSYHYPLYQDPNEQSYTPIYTGYERNNEYYATCHVPRIPMNTFVNIANVLGWQNNGAIPDISFFPNEIYMNSRYKMRRQFARMKSNYLNFNETINYVCEGYYAGFSNSEIIGETMHHLVKGQHFVVKSNFSTRPFRTIRHYFRYLFNEEGTQSPFTVVLNVTYPKPFTFTYQNTPINAIYNATTELYEITQDISNLSGTIEDQYFDLQSNDTGRFCITYSADRDAANYHVDVEFRLYTQCMIDDDLSDTGILLSPIPKGDVVFSSEEITEPYEEGEITYRWHKITVSGWNSLSWAGDMTEGYDGLLLTNFPPNSPYGEDFYNSSPALMWTNALDWFYNYSLLDVFTLYHNISGREFSFNPFLLQYEWGSTAITNIDNYVLYDEINFDDTFATIKYKLANGTEILVGNDMDNMKTVDTPLNQTISIEGKHFSTLYQQGSDVVLYAPRGKDDAPIANNTLLNKTKEITPVTHVSTMNDNAGGVFVYSNRYGGYDIAFQPIPYTTLEVGQIVTTHVMGYIPTQFVVYQTRTFRVLEQEIDANGVNELKLLLYK